MSKADNTHEASASAIGYLFQCRYALLAGLRAIPERPQLAISIEKFDDVAFDARGEPTQLIQTKHHLGKAGSLTDASVDLWKTIHIWAKRVATDIDSPFRVSFNLLTTALAPANSAASFLRIHDRNEREADKLLMEVAATSKSQENKASYAAYAGLLPSQRLNLLKAVVVLDRSPNIVDVRDEIARELYHAAPRDQVDHLTQRLEGWWFSIVIDALTGNGPSSIAVLAIDQRVDELREEFKRGALPIDFGAVEPPAAVIAELDRRPFVRQLRQINVGTSRVEWAIRDYYRASEQRSRWAREDLLVDGELAKYERDLLEAWEPRHAALQDELTPTCPPAKRVQLGQGLFRWAEQEANYPLRSVRDRFLTHGSFHILANRYVLGWHPDYKVDSPSLSDEA
ncbi:ABC-three component system protein [Sphingomonas faeni]|uniref:ABC-three component system protein n=1 Tax=Sphingomonas faeni TaxID=185950 RepID=UPI0033561837